MRIKVQPLMFLCLVTMLTIASCSPKATTETANTKPKTTTVKEVKPAERLTPCTTFEDLNASERDQAETAYVLLRDFVKTQNYTEAKKHWKIAYHLAPGSNGRVTYQFEDGVVIFDQLYNQATDNALKKAYVDTIMMLYDKRAECFGDPGYVAGRKAFDYYYKYPEYSSEQETFRLFREAVDAKGEDMDYFVVNPFTKMLFDKVVDESIDHQTASNYAKTILKAVEKGKVNCKDQLCDAWETIDSYAPKRLEALEGVDGFYDCEYYTDKYYPVFESDRANCETVELAYRRMLRGGCLADHAPFVDVKAVKDSECYTPPPPPGLLKQGYDCYSAGDYRCAVERFETYVNNNDDPERKAKYLMLIAKIYYGDIKNYPQSRKYALQAAEYKANWGEPYLLIGKLYASSGPICGPGRGWDSQIVTWPAIDKWEYAKKIDPESAVEANKLINTYRQYMPSMEEVFQRPTVNEGDKFTVGCWINEVTTVRPYKG